MLSIKLDCAFTLDRRRFISVRRARHRLRMARSSVGR